MATTDFLQNADDFQRIEKAIQSIETHFKAQPSLEEIARSVHQYRWGTARKKAMIGWEAAKA